MFGRTTQPQPRLRRGLLDGDRGTPGQNSGGHGELRFLGGDLQVHLKVLRSAEPRGQAVVLNVHQEARSEIQAARAEAVEQGRAHAHEKGRREEAEYEAQRLRAELTTALDRTRALELAMQSEPPQGRKRSCVRSKWL